MPAAPVLPGRRWLLPSAVVAELDPERTGRGGRPRRTARDWMVDFGCFVLAVVIGAMAAHTLTRDRTPRTPSPSSTSGSAASPCSPVWSRRRWPLGLGAAMIPVGLLSNTAGGAGLVALFALAVHRPLKYVGWVAGLQLALLPVYFWLRPDPDLSYAAAIAVTTLLTLAVVGWGMFVRSKRQLMLSLRDRTAGRDGGRAAGRAGAAAGARGDRARDARRARRTA